MSCRVAALWASRKPRPQTRDSWIKPDIILLHMEEPQNPTLARKLPLRVKVLCVYRCHFGHASVAPQVFGDNLLSACEHLPAQ